MKYTFTLQYTRDTTLIIQELWGEVETKGMEERFSLQNPHAPFVIDFLTEGAIEIWESEKAHQWLLDSLVTLSHSETKKIHNLLRWYEAELPVFEQLWKKEVLSSRKELVRFIEKVREFMFGDALVCYLAMSEKGETSVYEKASALRAADHFFAASDGLIRRTLRALYPSLKGYEVCILLEELHSDALPPLSECKKRFTHFVRTSQGYQKTESFESFKSKHPLLHFETARLTGGEIKGVVAQKGKARGKVKILRLLQELSKVKHGDIIVSPMTIPSFLPAMQRAIAMVTDEGGLLCHAAIVSRELKIPCVIGTKVATKVLKDGDLVEVDAEKGVVRIL